MKKIEIRFLFYAILIVALALISGCGVQTTATLTPSPSPTTHPSVEGDEAALDLPILNVIPTLVDIVPTRTPVPTATPDALTEGILQIVQETGLSEKTLFWLGYADWINLGISMVYVLLGYLIGTWLIRWLLPRLASRTKTNLDDLLLQISANELRWLAVVLIFRFAVNRLIFINAEIKTVISDITFFLAIFLIAWLCLRLINLAAQQANERISKISNQKEADSLITLIAWTLRLTVLLFVLFLTLNHLGVNITGFALILGVIILVLSLAGRNVLTDIISGAIILIDRPFRVGDRLDLPSLESWGDVIEIGMRSTKILSMENRMVVLPNSLIGKNQVVNYSYPDPSYYNMIKVVTAYDSDPEFVVKILVDAISQVKGVQAERGVDVLLMELTETHVVYWACLWVADYKDRFFCQDRVTQAIIRTLKSAGVVLPYRQDRVHLEADYGRDVSPGKWEGESQ